MGTKFFKVFLRRSYAKQMILTDKNTEQKMKFSIKYFFSKCNQIRSWSHLLKKFSVENFIFFLFGEIAFSNEEYLISYFE